MESRRYGLRSKFIATMVAAVAASLAATGLILIHYAHQQIELSDQSDLTTVARNIATQVSETLSGLHYKMDYLARDPDVRTLNPALSRRAISLVNTTSQLIDSIYFVDMAGRILAKADDPLTPRLEPASYSVFLEPLKLSAEARLSPLYVSKTGELAFAALASVRRGGKTVGVLAGATMLRLHSIGGIEGISIGRNGYAYIVGPSGRAIVYPKGRYIDGSFARLPALQALIRDGKGVAEYVDEQGEGMLAAYAAVPRAGWGVVVCEPIAESYEFADQMRVVMSLILLAGVAIAAALGALLAGRLAAPITALAGGVRSVAAGNLDVTIPVARRDEIGDLSEDFNEMTRRLALQRASIARAHEEMLLAERTLGQSEKMASIGILAAGLAHEIHNPLTVIAGFAEFLLGKTPDESAQRRPLQDILAETRRCESLVGRLLDLSKPKAPSKTPSDVNALVRETLELMRAQARLQRIEIEESYAENLPTLRLDADEMRQVFLNLLMNSCQALPSGGRIRARTRRVDGGIEVEFADDGAGISAENLPKVFNPFFTTKAAGTGLGLALSYAMIARHGGTIRASSRPDHETVFTLFLPATPEGGSRADAR